MKELMLLNVVTQTGITGVLILLLTHLPRDCNIEVWMLSETATVLKCFFVHFVDEQLPQSVLSNILGFRGPTGWDTISTLSDIGMNTCTCWKMLSTHISSLEQEWMIMLLMQRILSICCIRFKKRMSKVLVTFHDL